MTHPGPLRGCLRLLPLLLILLVCSSALRAQPTRNRVDNRGRVFYLGFLLTNGNDDAPRLMVQISAERATTGTITYVGSQQSFPVSLVAGQILQVPLIDTNELLPPSPMIQAISNNTLKMEFDQEVTVYGVNTQRYSSDTYLALPAEVCGTEYVVLSYPNTLTPDPVFRPLGRSDFPSQFAVIATEDGTTVEIRPRVRFNSRPDADPFQITLRAGQMYFAQAAGNAGEDVSGTFIRSSKPVIVYGSHQRTNIPWNEAIGRDHLVEQLMPIDRMPSRVFVTPHYQLPKTLPDANIYRVLAAYDNTVLSIDSTVAATLSAGQFVELPLDAQHALTSTRPIMVAQYQHSTVDDRFLRTPNDSVGDPFMMLALAPAQYDTSYGFISLDTRDFFYHFVNVVIPTERISTLRLDGAPVTTPFTRIEKSSYSFAQIPVEPGPHRMTAAAPFGLYSYGYGPYNSYGHPGAMVYDTLFKDQRQPDFAWRDTCDGVVGAAIDAGQYDFGIDTVKLTSARNVTLALDPYQRGADSARFRLPLIDPYEDGEAEIVAVDSAGLDRHYRIPVKGFTVAILPHQRDAIPVDTMASINGEEVCTSFTLQNYGGYTQRVGRLYVTTTSPSVRIADPVPDSLAPGETRTVRICFARTGDTSFTFEVFLDNGCLDRPLARIPVISGIDSLAPKLTIPQDPCALNRTVLIDEANALSSGIESVTPNFLQNATLSVDPALPNKRSVLTIERTDPYEDMIYDITVSDRAGNTVRLADTIGGFTVKVSDVEGEQLGVRVSRGWDYKTILYGTEECDTFIIQNYGLLEITLQRPRVVGNIEYSIPPAQLPITLAPGESRPLVVCLRPRDVGVWVDTFLIDFNCGVVQERIPLRVEVDPITGAGSDRCGNRIGFSIGGGVKRAILETPAPNPVHRSDVAFVSIGLPADSPVTLELFDAGGTRRQVLLDSDPLPAGIARLELRTSELPQGAYLLRMRLGDGTTVVQQLVVVE